VNEGAILVILEAMKMRNEVLAPADGTVKTVEVQPGARVNQGDVLVVLADGDA
jgi:biotin carboxyl carrier protein